MSYQFSSGFIAQECDDLLVLNEGFADTTKDKKFKTAIPGYKFIYRSKPIGLDNTWDLWLREDSTVVITLRGTTPEQKSMFANLYCAMMPSKGTIQLTKTSSFSYKIAEHERAAVHAGYLAGFAYIANDALSQIDSLYKQGYTNFLISGHSQGGAIAQIFSSWLHYLKKDKVYPNMNIKVYTMATPKYANMYYVYDYDNWMRAEWSFSLTNAYDPVPEVPLTTQMMTDINEPNPFSEIKKEFKKQPFIKRMVLNMAFNSMRRKAEKSSKSYQKYLGKYGGNYLKDLTPGLEMPKQVNSTYFLRPGVPISLVPDDLYFKFFKTQQNQYYHHLFPAYRFLLRRQYEGLTPLSN